MKIVNIYDIFINMKFKRSLSLLILFPTLFVSSCGFSGTIWDWFNNKSEQNISEYDEGLIVYENSNELKTNRGGGLIEDYPNTITSKLEYDYVDYTSNCFYSGIDSMPSTGDVNILVIPVKFKDYSKNADEATRSKIFNAYFGNYYSTGWHSVASYFYECSYGTLRISGVVSDWYAPNKASSDLKNSDSTSSLVKSAFEWYKQKYNSDGQEFDADKDGFIDCICLVYNAPSNYLNNDNLWAYTYWLQETTVGNVNEPKPNTYMWSSVSFMDESARISIDAHTYIHEMGHVMGLDDYYNYDSNSRYGAAGGFIMQDYNVGDHDPFSKMALGWVNPTFISGSTTLTIEPFSTTGQVLIFKNGTDMISPFDEYIAVDFYSPTNLNKQDSSYLYNVGYPKGPTQYGIRVWHVDARLIQDYNPNSSSYLLTNTIEKNHDYLMAMSNSTDSEYGSVIKSFNEYKLLHLLQQQNVNTFKNGSFFSSKDLWLQGDSFSMEEYKTFFVNAGRLNSNKYLNFSFNILELSSKSATIEVVM